MQFSPNGGVSWQFGSFAVAPVTEATVSGLVPGEYLFRVRAQNADGWGPWTTPVSATVAAAVDPPLTLLNVSAFRVLVVCWWIGMHR